MKQLLIVTDDAHTSAWIAQAVHSLDVEPSDTSASGFKARLLTSSFDLAIIDAERDPGVHADTIEHVAALGHETKALFIIERESLDALRLPVRATSDFLVRGASSDELAARVRMLLWPGEVVSREEIFRVDDLTINLATYQAHLGGTAIDFTYLEYALFAFLVTHPGRTYSREILLRRVWGTDYYGGSRTVDVHIRRIRSKIGAELSRRLRTVRNVGYLWEG